MQASTPAPVVEHAPAQPRQNTYYQGLILPEHPFVSAFFSSGTDAGPLDLGAVVDCLARGTQYTNARGTTAFETYAATLASHPQRPLVINCLGMATLLVSYLRKCGWAAEDVYVVLAGEKGKTEYHAWALVRAGAGFFYWINPRAPRLARRRGRDLIADFSIHAAFNDQQLCFTSDEKQALLVSNPQAKARFILFGKTQPGLQPALHKVVQQPAFFETQVVAEAGLSDEETQLLCSRQMLRRQNNDLVPGSHLTVIGVSQELRFHQITDRYMQTYCRLVAESKPTIRMCFEQELACGRRFQWETVCHAVMAGMLVDLGVANLLTHRGYLAADMDATEAWAFALDLADQAFGVQSVNHKRRRLAQLWHRHLPRTLRVTEQQVAQLAALAAGENDTLTPKDRLYLTHLGWVTRHNSALHTRLPFFGAGDMAKLLPRLTTVAENLVTQALLPALHAAANDPIWCALQDNLSLRHAGIRLLLEQGMARLIEQAVLAPFPTSEQAEPAWGRWLWEDAPTSPGLVDAMAAPPTDKKEAVS